MQILTLKMNLYITLIHGILRVTHGYPFPDKLWSKASRQMISPESVNIVKPSLQGGMTKHHWGDLQGQKRVHMVHGNVKSPIHPMIFPIEISSIGFSMATLGASPASISASTAAS